MTQKLTRRDFLEKTAAAAAVVALPRPMGQMGNARGRMFISLNGAVAPRVAAWPEMARLAARVGYGGVDWGLGPAKAAGLDATKALFAELKIRPTIVSLPLQQPFAGDDAAFQEKLPQLAEDAAFVSGIGCERMMLVLQATSGLPKDEQRKIVRDRLAVIAGVLQKSNLRLGMEFLGPLYMHLPTPPAPPAGAPAPAAPPPAAAPVPAAGAAAPGAAGRAGGGGQGRGGPRIPFIWTMPETVQLAKDCGPNVGVILDIWHWYHSVAIADILATDASRIVHVHLSDAKAMPPEDVRDNMRLMPGEGIIDMVGFLQALQKIGYTGGASPEPLGRIPMDMTAEDAAKLGYDTTTAVMKKAGVIRSTRLGIGEAVMAQETVHDVVIIGSGAGGGTVTKVLADLGVRVLLMEAGPMVQMDDFKNLASPLDDWHRGAGSAAELYTTNTGQPFQQPSVVFPPSLTDEPYTVAPGSQFRWGRSRCVGGRTNHYSRVQLRYSDYDFKNRSMKGVGFDWPINYADMAPYYDKAERLIGVTGRAEGLSTAPDGIFQTPAAFKPHEHLVYRSCEKLGIKATSSRQAVITSPLNGRPACIYCGQCGRGCGNGSNYASSYVQIFPAMQTGRVTVLPNSMARELIADSSGKVTAVSYIDKITGQERQVRCRTVVLSAAAPESARLLLNSKSSKYPQGLGNSGGMVGKYLTDTVGFGLSATVPYMRGAAPFSSQGYGAHLYIPWWKTDHSQLDFPLGYHVEVGGGGFAVPSLGFGATAYGQSEGYGLPMKQAIRDAYGMGTTISFSGRGSTVPNENCFCEIDPDGTKDKWGIPVLRFHWKWSDYELNEARHMRESFTAILETLGGTINAAGRAGGPGGRGAGPAGAGPGGAGAGAAGAPGRGAVAGPGTPEPPAPGDDRPQLGAGGGIIHEVGCVRMGTSPDNSVVNQFCQVHNVPNVFSADGGPFASHADKNPTHTIIALAWRTAEYLAEELRKGNV